MELSPTTLRNYPAELERMIRPSLGKVTLARLTAKNLDVLYGAGFGSYINACHRDPPSSPRTDWPHRLLAPAEGPGATSRDFGTPSC
jgi:hypothetical protein